MSKFLLRRLLQAIPTLFGISVISFILMLATPGDPITAITFNPAASADATAKLKRQLGLDQPPLVQYVYWLVGNDWVNIDVDGDGKGDVYGTRMGVLRGDFGQSIQYKRPVLDIIFERIPATLLLAVPAILVGYLIGGLIGLLSAIYQSGWFDQVARILTVIGNAVPTFWLGLILIIVFSVQRGWLPMSGMRDITKSDDHFNFVETVPYMIMPVGVLSLGIIASIARYSRTQVLEVLGQDYVRTAHAKGLRNNYVFVQHVARNALIPVITLLGSSIGFLLSGAVIVEQVFSWPGLGRLSLEAVSQRDYPVIMGTVIISAIMYIMGLLLTDMMYSVADPRIRLE